MWLDEVHIDTREHPGRVMVTRRADEAYLPECVASSFKVGASQSCYGGVLPMTKKVPSSISNLRPTVPPRPCARLVEDSIQKAMLLRFSQGPSESSGSSYRKRRIGRP